VLVLIRYTDACRQVALTSNGFSDMNDLTIERDQSDQDILTVQVADEALEAAASTITGAAMSFFAAPTVSVLVGCCSND
jgi:hypothetical protein